MMKKVYIKPCVEVVNMLGQEEILAASGFTSVDTGYTDSYNPSPGFESYGMNSVWD